MASKELWIYMLAYNLIRLLMAQSAFLTECLPRRLSFKHTVQLWVSFTSQWRQTYDYEQVAVLLLMIAEPDEAAPGCQSPGRAVWSPQEA